MNKFIFLGLFAVLLGNVIVTDGAGCFFELNANYPGNDLASLNSANVLDISACCDLCGNLRNSFL